MHCGEIMDQRISELVEFLDQNRPKPVLLVGDFMLDQYLYGDAERISPEAPVPVLRVVRRKDRLGGAGSVAASLLALGCRTFCAGVVGDDEPGRAVRSGLAEAGAELACLVTAASRATPLKQRLVGLAQHRIPQQLLRVDHEDCTACDAETMGDLGRRIEAVLPEVGAIAIEDYNKGLLAGGLVGWLADRARERSIPVIVDPAAIGDYGRYAGVSVITPNRVEASLAGGVRIGTIEQAAEAGRALRERHGIEAVVVTLDADGIYLSSSTVSEHVPTERREVFDVTGAGDVVLAALTYGLAAGLDLRGSSVLANVAGGWEVEQSGAVPITLDQLQWELLKLHRSHLGKVVDRRQLLRELAILRAHGKRVAFTNGCFDLLHPGHITVLEYARRQGDLLVVGLNSDRSVQSLKGPSRPLINQTDRARMIAALEAVDYVVLFDEKEVDSLVHEVRPDVLVKGGKGRDERPEGVVGYDFVTGYGGRVVLAPIESEYSTTGIIRSIVDRAGDDLNGA